MFNQSFQNMKGKSTFLAKAFLMLFAVLCSFTVARAEEEEEEVTIGSLEGAENNSYLPMNSLYNYSYTQQIYTSEEIGMAGTITSVTMWLVGNGNLYEMPFDIYMVEVDKDEFESSTDWVSVTDADIVYSGSVTVHNTEAEAYTFKLETPFNYSGTGNLVIAFNNKTGNWKSGLNGKVFTAEDGVKRAIYVRQDGSAYDPTAPTFTATSTVAARNVVTLGITPGEAPAVARPKNVTITYDGGTEATVSWDAVSGATAYEVDVNGTVLEATTTTKELTDLEFATVYTVKVRATDGTNFSDWTTPKSFTTDISDDMCQVELVLQDTYGDGWAGATLGIVDVLTGIVLGTYTIDGTAGKDPQTIYADVPNNRDVQLVWTSGTQPSWEKECVFTVTDVNGEVIYAFDGSTAGAGPTAGVLKTWTVCCTVTPWRAPSNLAASEITGSTAKLSWTENSLTPATAWVVAFKEAGDEFGEEEADSNPYVLTGLSPETTYIVKVRPATNEVEKWSDEITFTTDVAFPAPKDLAVSVTSRTANVSWTGNANADSYTLRYRKVVTGAEMTTNFDDSSLGEWTTIDADGDGYGWVLGSACGGVYLAEGGSLAGNGHNDSADLIVSGSFSNLEGVGALTPDNYLVSPKVTLGGRISFWAKGQDANYADEVFGVAVSTTSNTEPSAFTMVGASKTATGVWTQYIFDLSGFSGEGYVAIRHYNITDMFMLDIDDIVIEEPSESALPWTVVEDLDVTSYELTGLEPATEYEVAVKGIYDTDESTWTSTRFTTDIATPAPTELAADNITSSTAEITWTADPAATGATLQYAEGELLTGAEWYKYDSGTFATNIGTGTEGQAFWWAVMFPAGTYEGNTLVKVSVFDYNAPMTGTVTIYNDESTTAPTTQVAQKPIALTGANAFVEVNFDNLAIDPTKNIWVVVYNASGAAYCAGAAQETTSDPNGRWVSFDGSSWGDVANYGISGYNWMLRAEIGTTVDPTTLTWTTIENITSPYELTGLTPETPYIVQVQSIYAEGTSEWSAATGFTTLNANPVPYNVAADLVADGATLTWTGEGESYNLQYRTAGFTDVSFYDNFSNLSQWTIYTEGEGPGWIATEYGATAYSYDNDTYTAWDADNWLVSPLVKLRGTLEFYDATATNYPDSYEVRLSLTGNTIADFNNGIVLRDMAEAENDYVDIDLSAYEGQEGYIAIHHVSNDCYILAIQYIGIFGDGSVAAGEWQTMTVTEPTATLSGLATNTAYQVQIQSVQGTDESEWCDVIEFALLSLDSNADNNALLLNYAGMQAHVTLANRTLYQDGTWNTLCLPFSLSAEELAASPLAGADFRTLEGIDVTSTSVTLNFSAQGNYDSDGIVGTFPWIVKWESGNNIVNPQFANVTLYSSTNNLSYSNTASGYGVTFKGTYAMKEFTADDPSILFVGADNKLNYPLAGAKVGAFRGYFELEGFTMDEASGVKIFTNLDDEDATGIANVEKIEENTDWYDLSGRKLAGKPSMKGIYVNGGRKVTVK